jgi:hypothetical protein
MKSFYLGSFLLAMSMTAAAQSVSIRKIEVVGETIEVTYDIADARDAKYSLALYSSMDGYTRAISKVRGDIGENIAPGTGKKVIWDAKTDLGEYKGKISVELRGRAATVFVTLTNSLDGSKFKKGNSVPVRWEGGDPSLQLNVELYNGNSRVNGSSNVSNNGSYSIAIPKDVEPGSDYRIKVSDASNSSRSLYSGNFTVAKKSKTMLFVLPALAVGGVVAALAGGGGTKEEGIPLPPLPGN